MYLRKISNISIKNDSLVFKVFVGSFELFISLLIIHIHRIVCIYLVTQFFTSYDERGPTQVRTILVSH